VFTCVLHLLCTLDGIIPVDKNGKLKTENNWKTALGAMSNPGYLIDLLKGFKDKVDADLVPAQNFKAIRTQLADPNFKPEIIFTKSSCAAGLCDWIINITSYYDVTVSVEPMKAAVRAA